MVSVERTLVKSPPELWEIVDDEQRMRRWMAALVGAEEPVAVAVAERVPEQRLCWASASGGEQEEARIEMTLEKRGWGTHISVSARYEPTGIFAGRRQANAEQRMSELIEGALDELGCAHRRPFSRA